MPRDASYFLRQRSIPRLGVACAKMMAKADDERSISAQLFGSIEGPQEWEKLKFSQLEFLQSHWGRGLSKCGHGKIQNPEPPRISPLPKPITASNCDETAGFRVELQSVLMWTDRRATWMTLHSECLGQGWMERMSCRMNREFERGSPEIQKLINKKKTRDFREQ
ncbi:predicted protein [Histoplasma capsulatum var. duboisii H88]|uniref:Predicted protein n=2 Tax=Ajellomyces capsulatus TaxID=5037 RepID=F0UNA9_AJEC8|nr:predicted protein [Histoplasma capsulatum H143]EGC47567.1 predicted protein [Histoplasma capsulatum var. duboisii H88]